MEQVKRYSDLSNNKWLDNAIQKSCDHYYYFNTVPFCPVILCECVTIDYSDEIFSIF